MVVHRSAVFAAAVCTAWLLALSQGAVVANSSGASSLDNASSRVIHGEAVTDKSEYPFVVDLSRHDVAISSTRFCTGTLVAADLVLTAAHCVLNDGADAPTFATVGRIELEDGHSRNEHAQTFRAVASIAHAAYGGLGSPHDVALVLLNASSSAPTVKLADSSPQKDDVAWVVGYGIQMLGTVEASAQRVEVLSGRLQKTALRVQDKSFCDGPEGQWKTADGMICTAGVTEGASACRGDSGGGLFVQQQVVDTGREAVQVGVVSYGDAQCASEESGVFTDVANNLEWIRASAERLQALSQGGERAQQPQAAALDGGSTANDAPLRRGTDAQGGAEQGSERKFAPFSTSQPVSAPSAQRE